MARVAIPEDIQDQVLLLSRRRCCACFALFGDIDVKTGQIAHLDHDHSNKDLDNLAYLCLIHHDQYDSKTSQSKGLRETEVKRFRSGLYNIVSAAIAGSEEKFLKLFGADSQVSELAEWFKRVQDTALTQTAFVQCLGMRRPIPFDSIYRPTRVIVTSDEDEPSNGESYAWGDKVSRSILRGRTFDEKSITIDEFLRRDQDALIFSGPGWGKTTFLHHIFRTTVKQNDVLPVLITLRRPNAVADLEKYVEACSKIQTTKQRTLTLLLVDGYDEVSMDQRKRVSEALLRYQAKRAGKFYLTCREYYHVSGINAPVVRLDAFTRDDQVRFVQVFLSKFAFIRQNPEVVVSQLEERGFSEFLSHPLLLTLACIVRASSAEEWLETLATSTRCALPAMGWAEKY